MGDQANSSSLTERQAGAKILSLMQNDTPKVESQPRETTPEVTQDQPDIVEELVEEQTTEQETYDSEAEETELEDETEGTETDSEDYDDGGEDDGELYEVIVNGEKSQVPLEELINGYQRNKDYTTKAQKVAQERKIIQEQKKILESQLKPIIEDKQVLQDTRSYLLASLEQSKPQKPSIDMLDPNDPSSNVRYQRALAMYDQQLEAYNTQKQQIETYFQKKSEVEQKVRKAYEKQGQLYLQQKMPELFEEERAQKLYGYLMTFDYSQEDINKNVDPRLFIIAEKARRYDEGLSKDLRPTQNKPKRKSNAKTRRPNTQASIAQKQKELTRKAKASGSRQDAAAAIKALMQKN